MPLKSNQQVGTESRTVQKCRHRQRECFQELAESIQKIRKAQAFICETIKCFLVGGRTNYKPFTQVPAVSH